MPRDATGTTNKVWQIDDGILRKYITRSSRVLPLVKLHFAVNGEHIDLSQSTRLQREVQAKHRLSSIGVNTPRLLQHGEHSLDMEHVDGTPLLQVLHSATPPQCRRLGKRCGTLLHTVHAADYALIDARLDNLLLTDDDMLYSVDHELFQDAATRFHTRVDLLTVVATAMQLPGIRFRHFHQGFRTGYGPRFTALHMPLLFTAAAAFEYAIAIETSPLTAFNSLVTAASLLIHGVAPAGTPQAPRQDT